MRLSGSEKNTIKNSVLMLDKSAHVYLFGSRVDDSKRGGDIDILIESNVLTKQDLRKIRRQFFDIFGEQKMDLVLDSGDSNNAFINMVKPKAHNYEFSLFARINRGPGKTVILVGLFLSTA